MKVYAVDARNHGESPHSPNHGYEDLAEDVRLFYDTHNIDKAIVLGHSMGGRTMMTFALKYVRKYISNLFSPIDCIHFQKEKMPMIYFFFLSKIILARIS